ncbi:DNA-binding domain-containing protein [Uliginosibacterium sp. H3]|uniref:DNA-binding domain-containing protein n=1 Tax=Uliginosibacterium silvisoli TaxID=3114758 RepID=A0ABU6K273_9RHOO|nr:DNA-binding domain-containing protein [Uliginosibacterium sp. H3]
MPEARSLLEAQRSLAAAVRSSAQQDALVLLTGDAARNAELLAVYRGNAVANAGKALALSYPVIARIVGDEFFEALCRAYWAFAPSHSGDLNEYGGSFDEFLAGFPHVAELPYLPDVARVEWCVRRALRAEDHLAIDAGQLAGLTPEQLARLRFGVQPALVTLSSAWACARIWQQHQPDFPGEIDVEPENAECMAVHRQGLRADVAILGVGECAFWQAALDGAPLEDMLAAGFACDAAFDVQAVLQAGFARQFVTALHFDQD